MLYFLKLEAKKSANILRKWWGNQYISEFANVLIVIFFLTHNRSQIKNFVWMLFYQSFFFIILILLLYVFFLIYLSFYVQFSLFISVSTKGIISNKKEHFWNFYSLFFTKSKKGEMRRKHTQTGLIKKKEKIRVMI